MNARQLLLLRNRDFDPAALDWQARVYAASGSVSVATLLAVSRFVRGCRSAGVWDKLLRVNLFCGTNLSACLVPLKVGGGNSTDTNTNFVSGDYTEATGLTGNGSTKRLATGIVPSTMLTANSTHLAIYNRSSTLGAGGQLSMGARTSTSAAMYLNAPEVTDNKAYSAQYDTNTSQGRIVSTSALSTAYGFIVASRTAANLHTIYRNGASVGSNATTGGSLPAVGIAVVAWNNNGTPADYGAAPCGGYSIGAGLTAQEALAYYTAMQAFQTAMGRQV